MQDNGNVWRKYRVVPRAYPSHPLICAYFYRAGNKERFRLPGRAGDHFHCTVEPSPGHIRCRWICAELCFVFFCVLSGFSPANLTEISFRNCPSNAGIFWKTPSRKTPKRSCWVIPEQTPETARAFSSFLINGLEIHDRRWARHLVKPQWGPPQRLWASQTYGETKDVMGSVHSKEDGKWWERPECSRDMRASCHASRTNPEKSDLINFRGPDWRKFSELCVLLIFLGKMTKCSQNPGFSKPIFGRSAGSTKLDRPDCKRCWKDKRLQSEKRHEIGHLQLQNVSWKVAWNELWKILGAFELRFLRTEEQLNFTRNFHGNFHARFQEKISRQHFCTPCRDDMQ